MVYLFFLIVVFGGGLILAHRQDSQHKALRQELARLEAEIVQLRRMTLGSPSAEASAVAGTEVTAAPSAAAVPPAPPGEVASEPAPTPPISLRPAPPTRQPVASTAQPEAAPARQAALDDISPFTATPAAAPRKGMDLGAGLDKLAEQSPLINWFLGAHVFVRVGIVILFIGIAFLLRYASDQGWLSIEARLIGAAVAGASLVAAGWRLRPSRRVYGLTLQGGGLGIIYLTVFVAYRFYELLPAGMAFPLLVLLGIAAAGLAIVGNAMSLALLAMAGALAAPLLVDSGSDNALAFFLYLTIVNGAILGIAWFKAWRALNLVGFVATAILGTLWGMDAYTPAHVASVEPFVVLFFAFYLTIGLLFAMRQPPKLLGGVNGPLIIGTPIVTLFWQAAVLDHTEYGLAISFAAVGLIYLALSVLLTNRSPQHFALLRASFFVIGTIAMTLAVPAAFDNRITVAVWAVAGAGLVALGLRQTRPFQAAWGVIMQGYAGLAHLFELFGAWYDGPEVMAAWLNAAFIGGVLVALAGLATAYFFFRHARSRPRTDGTENGVPALLLPLHFALTLWGLGWWYLTGIGEIGRVYDWWTFFDAPRVGQVMLLFFVISGLLADIFDRRLEWPALRLASLTVWIPTGLLALAHYLAFAGSIDEVPLLSGLGWIAWSGALVLHFWVLRGRDGIPWLRVYHPLGLWLVTLLGTVEVMLLWESEGSAWRAASVVIVAALLVLLVGVAVRRLAWPLARHARLYLAVGATPLVVILALWTLYANFLADGGSASLSYMPLLNPIELTQIVNYLAGAIWYVQLRRLDSPLAHAGLGWIGAPLLLLLGINGLIARIAYHVYGVPFDWDGWLNASTLQTTFSIVWTVLALGCMVVAARQVRRPLWLIGAALLGVTVVKLLLLDMSGADTLARIVSFIVVGLLMLLIGYVAPIPPLPARELQVDTAPPAS